MIRTYKELIRYQSFEERYLYLALRGNVGESTFGFDRYLNQQFYTSSEWRHIRRYVITRDNGCDLAVEDHDIYNGLYIHHMNPMTIESIINGDPGNLDPEFLITVTHQTHNAIHYGDKSLLRQPFVERRPGDTKLW